MSELHEAVREPVVVIRRLTKSFAGNIALRDFNLSISPGEIHVLAGANGSGKSTLIKIMCGYHRPDPGGEILIGGSPLTFGSPDSAYRLGCRFVHQDLGLIANNSILDNLSLGTGYPTVAGTIRTRAALKAARTATERVGLHLDPRLKIADVGAADRTAVAIARAMREDPAHPARVMVLDEPTATMPIDDVDRLLAVLRTTADHGVAILFVTHHLEEVFRIADRVTVLRDGHLIGTSAIGEVDHGTLVEQMVGTMMEASRPPRLPAQAQPGEVRAPDALAVAGLSAALLRSVSFTVRAGEIVGFAGLTGSGRETLLSAIFGRVERDEGDVQVAGTRVPAHRPDLAIRAGMAYMPADRKVHGGIMGLTAQENISVTNLRPFWARLHLNRKAERDESRQWFEQLDVQPANAFAAPLSSFSGGNQQKILFGKWIRRQPAVFLLDEPTQGVDIRAKAELHRQLLQLADHGAAVVVSSADHAELAALCDRVLVVRNGRIIGELSGTSLNEAEITKRCLAMIEANEVLQ